MGMEYELLAPTDIGIDDFHSGNAEVDRFFKSRTWFNLQKNLASPPTYKFTDPDGKVIALVSVAFRRQAHPTDDSIEKALYLVVYAIGLNQEFQGVRFGEKSYAEHVFAQLETMATSESKCFGVSLWVRSDNEKAIAFYEKVGLKKDETGPIQRDSKQPHITMRKILDI